MFFKLDLNLVGLVKSSVLSFLFLKGLEGTDNFKLKDFGCRAAEILILTIFSVIFLGP